MDKLLKAREVSERTGMPVSSVYRAASLGQLPTVRYGSRAVRFPESEIRAWIERSVESALGKPEAHSS